VNHRAGLYDGYLVKENHLSLVDPESLPELIQQARASHPDLALVVEADSLELAMRLLLLPVDRILVDNLTADQVREIVNVKRSRSLGIEIEASGGVFIHNPTGRVDQRDHASEEAVILHAAGVRQITALHPNFIEPLCTGLAPTDDEMTWAQTVLDVYQELTLAGESMTTVDGRVVDCYEYALAVKTLEWGRACTEKDRFKEKALARTNALLAATA
jgi:hypothetical protein